MDKRLIWRSFLYSVFAFACLTILAALFFPGAWFQWRMWAFLGAASLAVGFGGVYLAGRRQALLKARLDRLLNIVVSGNLTLSEEEAVDPLVGEFPGTRKLVRSFRNLIGYLKGTSDNVSHVSQIIGEKTKQLTADAQEQVESVQEANESIRKLDEEIAKVVAQMDTLSGFTETSTSSILQMRSSIEEVVEATHHLSDFVDEIAQAMYEMVKSVDGVAENADSLSSFAIENASSMVEMDATISQIEENIRETETLSEQVITVSDQGAASVKNTVSGLEKIEISVGTISEAVESLGVRSQQIGNILKVIREIADQTNLLALNAAIIAAQAGEHGKGFAVVAEEIRDLAERTASSTSEVGEIVGAIQKDVSVAVKVAQEGKVRVQEGVKLGRTAETALQNISKQINMAGNSISHIARAAAEQAKGSSQVTEAIEEMTKRIEFISVATREQVQAGRNISKKTETMKELTSSVDSAMQEQAVGSDGISRGMEKLREAVGAIQHALLGMSQAGRQMVKSVDVIGGASGQTLGSSRDLSNTAANLRQDALLLAEELLRFKLPQPKRGGELRLGYTSYGYNLDPAYATNVRDGELVFNIHEGLVKFDYGTKVAPALAETWNVSADGRVYTFRLRKQAKFHNGKHVTAQDVIFAWHRCMSPVLDNTGKWFLNWVEGVEAFKEGAADSIAGLKTPDDSTVEVTLREPLAFFLYMLAAPEASIVPREAVDENTLRLMKPIGVGPYRVAESAPRSVTLQRFEEYYDPDEGYVDRLVFDYDSPTSDELKAKLKSGRIHLVPAMAPDSLEELLEDPEWRNLTESTILLNTSLVAVRCDLDPLSSREVRQALNYAVDKEFLVSRYPHSSPKPARGILPPGILGHNPSRSGYPYDPDKARWLLQRAGLASGFSLHVPTDTSRVNQQREFELIVDMLAKVGVRIEIEPLKHEEFLTRSHHEGRPPLYQTGWFADYPDPDNFIYVLFNSKAGDVLSLSYSNPEVDSLSERARSSLDISERIELYRKTEDILVEEAPFILLYHGMGVVPHRKEVMGLRLSMTPPVLRPGDVWFSQGS